MSRSCKAYESIRLVPSDHPAEVGMRVLLERPVVPVADCEQALS